MGEAVRAVSLCKCVCDPIYVRTKRACACDVDQVYSLFDNFTHKTPFLSKTLSLPMADFALRVTSELKAWIVA